MKISSGRTLTFFLMINRLPTKNVGNGTDNPDIYSAEAVKAHCSQEIDLNAHCIDEGDVVEYGREDNFAHPELHCIEMNHIGPSIEGGHKTCGVWHTEGLSSPLSQVMTSSQQVSKLAGASIKLPTMLCLYVADGFKYSSDIDTS